MHNHDLHQRSDSDADAAGDGDGAVAPAQLPALGIIGAGKVGSVLARLCFARGYRIAAVYSRDPARSRGLAETVGAVASGEAGEVVRLADLTLLTVTDDSLKPLVHGLTAADWSAKAAVHTSGVHDAAVLVPLVARGAVIGGLHPAFPFADVETAAARLPGATFAIEAEDTRLRGWLLCLVAALQGRALLVPPGGKALYHAALVFASNYTVTLYAAAERLLLALGADRAAADNALNVLVGATVENLRAQGVPDALTGPLVRGDVGTAAAHLRALRETDPALASVYAALARLTLPLLQARGVPLDPIERLLRQEDDNATDNP